MAHIVTTRRRMGIAAVAAALVVLLAGCAFAPPATRTPDPALASLAKSLTQIDGVQDAVAATSHDGSPSAKRLNLRVYLDEPETKDVVAIATESLRLGWNFHGFVPSAYSLQIWNGPRQSLPYDNSKRVDLTTVLPELDMPHSRVYKGDLTPTISDLEAKFGARE